MVELRATNGTELVKVHHETRSKRARRQKLMRLGIWIFLFVFAFSVAGGIVAFVVQVPGTTGP